MRKFYRQGDILFERLEDGADTDVFEKLDTKTVALGELTGHHHSFQNKDQVLLFKKPEEELPSMVTIQASSTLTHQEHKPITFEKGVYRITREQSYNPFLKQIQRSVD